MELKFFYPRWGSAEIEWPIFLEKIRNASYQGVELSFSLDKKENKELLGMFSDFGMKHIGQHWQTKDVEFKKHKENYKRHLYNLAETEPLLINAHTGMDFFSFAQNVELIELADKIEQETGVPISHETHRSRFAFAAHVCFDYLVELPFLKLTADLAHWTCVAESLLENQKQVVIKTIAHTYHLHMRVGSSQSSQVLDPRDRNYSYELDRFIKWWMAMIENSAIKKRPYFTIVPEQGPFPYGLCHKDTQAPIVDQWKINEFIKNKVLEKWAKTTDFKSE